MKYKSDNLYRIHTGKKGENIAVEYLKNNGYTILDRNFRTLLGEIDIIASNNGTLVFIEVKTRKNNSFGMILEQVSLKKAYRISNTAEIYRIEKNLLDMDCRMDLICIFMDDKGYDLSHYSDIFHECL